MTDPSHTDQDPTRDRCPTCEHPFSAHDRVGARWCAATQLGVGQGPPQVLLWWCKPAPGRCAGARMYLRLTG